MLTFAGYIFVTCIEQVIQKDEGKLFLFGNQSEDWFAAALMNHWFLEHP
jgi:hypothetical protein